MKTIIIFSTAAHEKVNSALKESDSENNKVYFVVPQSKCACYAQEYKNITYITTEREYMDYLTLMSEKRIPDIQYDEAWVPSSQQNNMYAFGDVYAVIDELNCKKTVWIASDGSRQIILRKSEGMKNLLIKFIFWTERKKSFLITNLKGYKW